MICLVYVVGEKCEYAWRVEVGAVAIKWACDRFRVVPQFWGFRYSLE
jgi:hypothetical protein